MKLPHEIANAPGWVQAHYVSMIEDGQDSKFAEMCALMQPPGTGQSERAFMEGRNNGEWLNKLPRPQAMRMLKAAREAGVDPAGKYYFGGIADKRGIFDPKAWVSDAHDVKRVAEERGLDVEGSVKHRSSGRPADKNQDVPLAADIVKRETAHELLKDPSLSKKEARRKAIDNVTPHWKKKKNG